MEFNFIFVINDAYFEKMLVTAFSVIETCKGGRINFFVLNSDIPSNRIESLNIGPDICFFDVKVSNHDFLNANPMRDDGNFTAYLKTLIPFYIKIDTNYLYLDCDLLVLKNLNELFLNEKDGFFAVLDSFCAKRNKKYFDEKHINTTKYFNSGVILFRLSKETQTNYCNSYKALVSNGDLSFRFHDQDIFNILVSENITLLDSKYNTFTFIISFKSLINWNLSDVVILHYCNLKPWKKDYFGKHKKVYKKYYHLSQKYWKKSFMFYEKTNLFCWFGSIFHKFLVLFKK